jgi:hypothetical protein
MKAGQAHSTIASGLTAALASVVAALNKRGAKWTPPSQPRSIDRRVGFTFDNLGRSSVCWPLIVPGTACAIIIAHTRVNWASAHAGR